MSKRTKLLLGIGVIAALVIGWQVAAFAVHDAGVFELDGNATDEPVTGDDWANVFNNTDHASATAFLEEEPADASSIFTGGGSKDPIDIPSWKWKDGGGLPDKDNLLHAFAAEYTGTTGTYQGDDLLYFGSDRFDNSGDAVQGFWFFKNDVTDQGTPSGTFTGTHAEGDLLVLSDFSNGGTVATIAVYEWNPDCAKAGDVVDGKTCGDANLLTLASSNSAKCTPALTNDDFCGIVNPNTITMPWTFNDKTPNNGTNTALNGEFYEAGVNLTALGLGDTCFSSVAAETRSSTSTTAVLKDFVIGKFGNCTSGMNTVPVVASDNSTIPTGGVSPGTAVKDGATITVTGVTNWSGTLDFHLCGPTQGTTFPDCSAGGTAVGTTQNISQATSQPIYSAEVNTQASPLAPGNYCFRGDFTSQTTGVDSQSDSDSSECFTVRQPTTVSTVQRWIPQDTATVTPAGTAGTVTFNLYSSTDCTGTPIYTEQDNSAPFATNNTNIIDDTTVSWQASFDPSGNEDPSTGVCETANVTFDDDGPNAP